MMTGQLFSCEQAPDDVTNEDAIGDDDDATDDDDVVTSLSFLSCNL